MRGERGGASLRSEEVRAFNFRVAFRKVYAQVSVASVEVNEEIRGLRIGVNPFLQFEVLLVIHLSEPKCGISSIPSASYFALEGNVDFEFKVLGEFSEALVSEGGDGVVNATIGNRAGIQIDDIFAPRLEKTEFPSLRVPVDLNPIPIAVGRIRRKFI
jgi:hypothetical protein